jgi:hypothetical protein
MKEQSRPPDGWIFESNEVSPGQYRVVGRDASGHEVERHASEPDLEALLREAWAAAWWVESQLPSRDVPKC